MKRFELKQGDVVVLYFDEMVVERDYCVGVDVRAAFEVNDAKDANVKIYDYYQPEHAISVSYNLLPSAGVIDDENGIYKCLMSDADVDGVQYILIELQLMHFGVIFYIVGCDMIP